MSLNSISDSLSLNFLVYFAEISSFFPMKTNKRKDMKCRKYVKEFLHRFDLANEKNLSIFVGIFVRIVKVTHFAQVINFLRKAPHKKCPHSELFWSAFSCIRTEYREMQNFSPYSVQMRETTDQNNSKYGHFFTQ